MASVYDLKPAFQNLLRPVARGLAGAGFTANQVTVAACALSLVTGQLVLLLHHHRRIFLIFPFVLFARMAMNAIDGMMAREFGQKSKLGAVLNELTDVISDVGLYLPFAFLRPGALVAFFFFLVFAVMVEMAGVIGVQIGASRRYDGPFGKSDRALWLGLLAVLVGLHVPLDRWLPHLFLLFTLLSAVTVFQRSRRALLEAGVRDA